MSGPDQIKRRIKREERRPMHPIRKPDGHGGSSGRGLSAVGPSTPNRFDHP
jgi:hypothetical protein